jgi:glucose-1-phosphatase
MKGIQHIIFDLGNVILNIDYQATIDAFEALGIKNFNKIFSKEAQNNLADDIETGAINPDVFIQTLLEQCNAGTTKEQVVHAWNAIIGYFPQRRLQLLQQLQLHYNLYLLSNTNVIHEQCYNNLLMQYHGLPTLAVFFNKIYLSHHIGLRKPNPAAWQLILTENNLTPEHTLFLDDSPQHIEAAKKLGIHCIHISEQNNMEDIFK